MPLIAYSDSEADDDDDRRAQNDDCPIKRHKHSANDEALTTTSSTGEPSASLPRLPDTFFDLYSAPARISTSDDPALHGGRKRLVPHVEGNWSAHVYLEFVPDTEQATQITKIINAVAALPSTPSLSSLLYTSTSVPAPLHISLSAPLVLNPSTKPHFLSRMTSATYQASQAFSTLTVHPRELTWFPNASGTRTFLVLIVDGATPRDDTALQGLLDASNSVARQLGCESLYSNCDSNDTQDSSSTTILLKESRSETTNTHPLTGTGRQSGGSGSSSSSRLGAGKQQSFHISIAWVLGSHTAAGPLPLLAASATFTSTSSSTSPPATSLTTTTAAERSKSGLGNGIGTITFREVKIKLGRDVTGVRFGGVGRPATNASYGPSKVGGGGGGARRQGAGHHHSNKRGLLS